jgi:hypothetical protein
MQALYDRPLADFTRTRETYAVNGRTYALLTHRTDGECEGVDDR